METPTPDAPPSPPDQSKPRSVSIFMVLFALLFIIPGLCFGLAIPQNWASGVIGLAIAWVVVLIAFVIALLVGGLRMLFK